MPLPPYITLEDSFGEWLVATNNLTSHVDNTSAYVLVTQNATPRVSTGNVSINGTATVTTLVLQGAVTANGSNGAANQVLTTNGTGVYWANAGGGGSATANSAGGNGAIQFYNGTNLGSSTRLIFSDDGYANKVAVGNSTANVSLHGWYTWGPALIANSANTTIILGADNDTYDGSVPDGNTGKLTNNSISLRAASGTVAIFQTVKTDNNTIIEPYGSDVGKLFRCTSNSPVTVYLPTEAGGPVYSDPNLVGGTWYFFQEGTGQVTVTGYPVEVGITTIIYGPTVTIGQYSLLSAQLVTANSTHRAFVTTVSYLSNSSVTFANITTSGNVTVGNATSNSVISGQTLLLRANTTVNALANATTLLFRANTTVNTSLSATTLTLANSSSNTQLTAAGLTINDITATGTITGNVTGTASNATNLNSQPGSYYTNASNLATGTVPLARLTSANTSANGVVDITTQTFAGDKTFQNAASFSNTVTVTGNLILQDGLRANGSNGSSGQVLTSNGGGVYWNTSSGATANTAGGTGAIQFYNGTTLGSDANLVFTNNSLVINTNVAILTTNTSAYTLYVNGSFAATTKSFVIPHPLDAAKTLRYGSLEGPENGVYVRGRAQTAVVALPDYWSALVNAESLTVSLTSMTQDQRLYVVSLNTSHLVVSSGKWGRWTPDFCYVVHGTRQDVPDLMVES